MDFANDWFSTQYLGIALWRYLAFAACLVLGYLGGKIAAVILAGLHTKSSARQRQLISLTLLAFSKSIVFLAFTVALRAGLLFLPLEGPADAIVTTVTAVLFVLAVGWVFFQLTEIPSNMYARWAATKESKLTDMLEPMIRTSLRVTVVGLTLVQVAQVISDKPITSIIAGLGIGGVAIALASQDSLKHLFGSIVIFADRPFEVGDRLVIDGHDGPVEEVGFRSTKLRTLDGHLVTVPNGELINKSILNISKRPFIRRIANITITYDTPPDKIERAVEILREILDNHEGMDEEFPPRVFFNEFNSDSLNIIVIYWYHPPAYWDYLAFCQKFNLEVFRRFDEEGIDFAFPTQTLYLAGDRNRPLSVGIRDLDRLPDEEGGKSSSSGSGENGNGNGKARGGEQKDPGEEA